jgi:hypothetical protein
MLGLSSSVLFTRALLRIFIGTTVYTESDWIHFKQPSPKY